MAITGILNVRRPVSRHMERSPVAQPRAMAITPRVTHKSASLGNSRDGRSEPRRPFTDCSVPNQRWDTRPSCFDPKEKKKGGSNTWGRTHGRSPWLFFRAHWEVPPKKSAPGGPSAVGWFWIDVLLAREATRAQV